VKGSQFDTDALFGKSQTMHRVFGLARAIYWLAMSVIGQ
jgi:hypothetical protein